MKFYSAELRGKRLSKDEINTYRSNFDVKKGPKYAFISKTLGTILPFTTEAITEPVVFCKFICLDLGMIMNSELCLTLTKPIPNSVTFLNLLNPWIIVFFKARNVFFSKTDVCDFEG